jgi:hypothetical protein
MSTISDVQDLYHGLQGGLQKSREHVFTHLVFAFIVFVLFGAEFPPVKLLAPDPLALSENAWLKLAKDTGLIFPLLIIPILLLAIYTSLFGLAGRLMVGIAMAVAPPVSSHVFIDASNITLVEPLAILTKKDEFNFADIQAIAMDFLIRYQAQNSTAWQNYEKSISSLNKNALIYLGDFIVFFLVWNFAFFFSEHSAWIRSMHPIKLGVSAVLFLVILASWFRVSRALSLMPRMLISNIAIMVRADEDLLPVLEVSTEIREKVRARLFKLLADSHVQNSSSLLGMLVSERLAALWNKILSLPIARNFKQVYLRGERLRSSVYSRSDSLSLSANDCLALVAYKLIARLELTRRSILAYLRFILTGSA